MPNPAVEIERRFLVDADLLDIQFTYRTEHGKNMPHEEIEQVYAQNSGGWTIRARQLYTSIGECFYYLTCKSKLVGEPGEVPVMTEIEAQIEGYEYNHLRDICGHQPLRKRRWLCFQPKPPRHHWPKPTFVIDEFLNPKISMLIAEIELRRPDQSFDRPDWLGTEITGNVDFSNKGLVDRYLR